MCNSAKLIIPTHMYDVNFILIAMCFYMLAVERLSLCDRRDNETTLWFSASYVFSKCPCVLTSEG